MCGGRRLPCFCARRLDPETAACLERDAALRHRFRPARGPQQPAEGEKMRRDIPEMPLGARLRERAHQRVRRRHGEHLPQQAGLPREALG